jgi:hypothetical protein
MVLERFFTNSVSQIIEKTIENSFNLITVYPSQDEHGLIEFG